LDVAAFARWWRQPSHYDWLSGYIQARGISRATRLMMAVISASLSLCLVALLAGAGGPRDPVPVAMTWIAFAGGVAGMLLWSVRWPSPGQSVAFALVTNASIALACLAYPEPVSTLVGCIAFATTGAYIAFFLTSKYVVYNFVVAAAVATTAAVEMASDGRVALAAVDLFLVLQVNIALPLAIQVLIRALANDLVRADLDPLTNLCNRRSFQLETMSLLLATPSTDMFLLVAVVDLDDFKSINDQHGHLAGDRVLVDVANALRASTCDTAVIARSGGEEFVVADTSPTGDAEPLARRICDAIAGLPVPVTASVGTACARLDGVTARQHETMVHHLVGVADKAMYRAKRSGGNRFHHYGYIG
jgi:diguanylate cyclase (GGDEF)-like protein